MKRPTLACDFDGVIHRNDSWPEFGDLMPGAKEGLMQLHKRYELVCFTARHNLDDVEAWMREHGILHLFRYVTNRKPAAVAYIDDRAIKHIDWQETLNAVWALGTLRKI